MGSQPNSLSSKCSLQASRKLRGRVRAPLGQPCCHPQLHPLLLHLFLFLQSPWGSSQLGYAPEARMRPLRVTQMFQPQARWPWPVGLTASLAALTPGHRQARQKTARLSLVSLEPSVSAKPSQTRQGEKKLKVAMEPHRRELLALWQQSLAQAMMEVEAMLRSRGRAVPRQMATAGGGNRRPQGGAVAPRAPGQGAGPLPGPALFTEEDAASPAAHPLTKGCHLAATVHRGSR